jgi:hypothetical protein
MAKKSAKGADKENKSAAIRDYISKNSGIGPTAVANALNTEHGWKISAAYVSTIKNKMGARKSARRRARAATAGGRAVGGGVNEGALIQAKKLAEQIGSIDQAKAALDLLGRLTS